MWLPLKTTPFKCKSLQYCYCFLAFLLKYLVVEAGGNHGTGYWVTNNNGKSRKLHAAVHVFSVVNDAPLSPLEVRKKAKLLTTVKLRYSVDPGECQLEPSLATLWLWRALAICAAISISDFSRQSRNTTLGLKTLRMYPWARYSLSNAWPGPPGRTTPQTLQPKWFHPLVLGMHMSFQKKTTVNWCKLGFSSQLLSIPLWCSPGGSGTPKRK